MNQAHVIVVDDEPEIRETVREYLELHGFTVSTAHDGAALRASVDAGEPIDVAILDINMPGEDGLSLARFLRESTRTGIIMLTAADTVVDRIVGLEMGADDYMSKPVDLRELLARIRAVLRRSRESGAESQPAGKEIPFGRCRLDVDRRRLLDDSGEEVKLTSMEFDLIKAFADNPDRVLSRDQLLTLAHHRRWDPFDRSIDIRISRIRRKIEPDPKKPSVIKTVHGIGYVFSQGRT